MLMGAGSSSARALRTTTTVGAAAVRSVSAGVSFDKRRIEERKGWRLPYDEDPDILQFPRERLGNTYELNWTLNRYQIVPKTSAYRNLHTRGLQMLSKSKADKEKRVCVEVAAAGTHETFYVQPQSDGDEAPAVAIPAGANVIPAEQFRYILRDVRKYLSSVDEIFLHDGAVGSSSAAEVTTRCFLDSAIHALYLKHMLNRVPFRTPFNFKEKVRLFVTSELAIDASYKLPKNFTVIDPSSNTAVVCGSPASTPIREGLISLAAPVLEKDCGAVAVAGHTVFVDGKSALVFADANSVAPSGVEQYSAAHTIWGQNGLSRAWNGITCAPTANAGTRGDLLEIQGSSKLLTSALPNSRGAAVSHPTAAVFVSSQAKGTKALDAKQALEQLKASGQVLGSSFEAVKSLMETNNVKAYAVGASDVAKGISAAVNGK